MARGRRGISFDWCFCGFSRNEATPERTAFVRFRRALIVHGLDRRLFEMVTAQLKAKAIIVKTGTLVDATLARQATCLVFGEPPHGYRVVQLHRLRRPTQR